MKISTYEPAERPFKIDLSDPEVLALAKYHYAQQRKIPRELGKALLKSPPAGISRAKMAAYYQKEGQALIDAHSRRARGLLAILRANG
jgi:hypothetical protein